MPNTMIPPGWPGADGAVIAELKPLIGRLAALDGPADESGGWSEPLWQVCLEAGANRWGLPVEFGGLGCDRAALLLRYAQVAEGSLSAALILTQHDAAVRRLAAAQAQGREMARKCLTEIGKGKGFATVGISQLTTSRRHGTQALTAREATGGGLILEGVMPWVTAAERADVIVTGAVFEDGGQVLVAVPRARGGLVTRPAFELAALQASCTTEVICDGVKVAAGEVLAGPSPNVMAIPGLAGTGGLETSALALGQARAALVALYEEAGKREEFAESAAHLGVKWGELAAQFGKTAADAEGAAPPAEVRAGANGLVLQATQAYLAARKGTGFLASEPAQRWARQALFFLVWSCPTPIARRTVHDLAGLCEL